MVKSIREDLEDLEASTLCKEASLSKSSLGRKLYEMPCEIRTEYQRDRDRILHSKSFRRLKHKTQVFISPLGDYYRTRLTHTLEVSQISRTVARALKLNEDLTEAISLGHDLGHTPFGHAGENILNKLCPTGFRHYKQSVRILETLEKEGQGLNLTKEVLDGILKHTSGEEAFTVEGRIVRLCDKVAYINHDIEDSIRAGMLNINSVPKDIIDVVRLSFSSRINIMVNSIVTYSKKGNINMGSKMESIFDKIHNFMYKNVYLNKRSFSEEEKVPFVISSLYNYFKTNPDKLPQYLRLIAKNDGIDRVVCDYIAGMTDQFAISLFKDLFLPRPSKVF